MSTRLRVLTLGVVGERLVTETCYSCGVLFAMVEDFYNHRQQDKKSFFCPNGHSQAYIRGKSDAEKLRDATARETALKDQLSAAIRDADSSRVALLRDRQRFANGVCPCCNRSFAALRRHMATQHPEFPATTLAPAPKFKCSCGNAFETLRGLRTHQGHQRREGWDKPTATRWAAHLTKV